MAFRFESLKGLREIGSWIFLSQYLMGLLELVAT